MSFQHDTLKTYTLFYLKFKIRNRAKIQYFRWGMKYSCLASQDLCKTDAGEEVTHI